jgi:hypothetical protein
MNCLVEKSTGRRNLLIAPRDERRPCDRLAAMPVRQADRANGGLCRARRAQQREIEMGSDLFSAQEEE